MGTVDDGNNETITNRHVACVAGRLPVRGWLSVEGLLVYAGAKTQVNYASSLQRDIIDEFELATSSLGICAD